MITLIVASVLGYSNHIELPRNAVSRIEARQEKDPPKDPKHEAELAADSKLGEKYAAEVEKELKVSTNKEYIERVNRIGETLAAIANKTNVEVLWGDKRLNPFTYHFKVLEGKDVNAFSIPGGYIYVYEGLVKYTESDDELAGVLAHEISHASFRHIAIRSQEANKLDAIMLPLILALLLGRSENSTNLALGVQYLRQALSVGWNLKAEESADFGGFQYMLKSDYNPVGMLTFMERLRYDEMLRPNVDWGIFATHPPTRERAKAFIERLRMNSIAIRRSATTTSLRSDVVPGDNGAVELWYLGSKIFSFGGSAALSRADQAAERINQFMDGLPKLFEVRVDDLGNIVGGKEVLFAIAEPDWLVVKSDEFTLQNDTVRALKGAIYKLNQRVQGDEDGPNGGSLLPKLGSPVPPSGDH